MKVYSLSIIPQFLFVNPCGKIRKQHVGKVMTQVIKRDGRQENLDITKIRKVIVWAIGDFDLNPDELEAKISIHLKNGITTEEIQEHVIQCASELTSVSEPDWRYVAGRLYLWNYRRNVAKVRGFDYGSFGAALEYLQENVRNYVRFDEYYEAYDIEYLGKVINSKLDLDYDLAGAKMLVKRYLHENELPQEMYMATAMVLGKGDVMFASSIYEAIAKRKISLATPILTNGRTQGSLSSCFITSMSDSLESIFGNITDVARISKNGGGVGVNVSNIRAVGSEVRDRPNSSGGVVPWIKILNDTALAVNQG